MKGLHLLIQDIGKTFSVTFQEKVWIFFTVKFNYFYQDLLWSKD